jgi:SAM-dependent methyltransferase
MTDHPLQAALLDLAMRPLQRQRARVIAQAVGTVVEIGLGTGLNLPLYQGVDRVLAVEPDGAMRARAAARIAAAPFPVDLRDAGGEALPFDDAVADTVVITWVLCTAPDPAAVLAEAWRVLKPGGRLLFAEHVRSPTRAVAALQDLVNPGWRCLAAGCNLNRDTLATLAASPFRDLHLHPPRDAAWSPAPSWRGDAAR